MGRLSIALFALLLTACAGDAAIKSTPDTRPTGSSKPPTAAEAKVGDPIALAGSDDLKARVTIVQIVDPAKPTGDFDKPEEGTRWVAVQMRIENISTATVLDDTPSNGINLIDTEGQSFDTYITGTNIGGPALDAVKIKPGDARSGWLVFKVPTTSKVAKIQFALNSGFADQTGEWTV